MSEPATAVPAGTDNPPEQRTCRDCQQTKVVSSETWPYRNQGKGTRTQYRPHGQRCKLCEAARVKAYEARRGKVAELVADVEAEKPKRKDEVEQAKLDAAKSLKLGSRVLNEAAAGVMARILGWAEDEDDENHRWAVQFLAERILPRKLYEELGGQAAGVGQLQDKRPHFTIQVLPATVGEQPSPRVFDNDAAQTVEVLPAPPSRTA